jgi:hypothetical protein
MEALHFTRFTLEKKCSVNPLNIKLDMVTNIKVLTTVGIEQRLTGHSRKMLECYLVIYHDLPSSICKVQQQLYLCHTCFSLCHIIK